MFGISFQYFTFAHTALNAFILNRIEHTIQVMGVLRYFIATVRCSTQGLCT